MAFNKKGFRLINVAGERFWWKFNGKVVIVKEDDKTNRLVVDIGWYDEWLYVNEQSNKPKDFDLKVVTPEFVRKSILFVRKEGWESGEISVKYSDGLFMKKR